MVIIVFTRLLFKPYTISDWFSNLIVECVCITVVVFRWYTGPCRWIICQLITICRQHSNTNPLILIACIVTILSLLDVQSFRIEDVAIRKSRQMIELKTTVRTTLSGCSLLQQANRCKQKWYCFYCRFYIPLPRL